MEEAALSSSIALILRKMQSVSATTVAARDWPLRYDISPKHSPLWITAMLLSPFRTEAFPLRRIKKESSISPSATITLPEETLNTLLEFKIPFQAPRSLGDQPARSMAGESPRPPPHGRNA